MKKGFPISKVAILADPRSSESKSIIQEASAKLHDALLDYGIVYESFVGVPTEDIKPSQNVQLFLVLGGDGTMIHFTGPLSHWGLPFYGLNYGHLGFMMNTVNNDLKEHARRLAEGQFLMWSFPFLEADAIDCEGHHHFGHGLNDIYLQRMTPQSCKVDISLDQEPLAFNPMLCDGVIVSTPLGSTAYSYNITGAMVSIDAEVLILTPVAASRTCPMSSLVIPMKSIIEFTVKEPVKRAVMLVCDGQSHGNLTHATIKISPKKATLCYGSEYGKRLALRFVNRTQSRYEST